MKILKKEEGSANSIAFMLVMIFAVMLIAVVTVKVQMVYAAKKDVLNALEASEYGALLNEKDMTYKSIFDLADNGYEAIRYASLAVDPDKAYNSFSSAVSNNINGVSGNVTIGDMQVTEFRVYNVTGASDGGLHRDVEEYVYNTSGRVAHNIYRNAAADGSVTTPTGKVVTDTCVYARVDYTIRIYKNEKMNAYLDLTCGIRRDNPGEHDIKEEI